MTKKAAKQSDKMTGRKTGVLVKQKHGGALLNGMAPNHVPGPDRPPSVVRAASREGYYQRIPTLQKIADNELAKDSDRIAAIANLGKVGMTSSVMVDDVRECLAKTIAEIRSYLPSEQAEALLDRIKPFWRT